MNAFDANPFADTTLAVLAGGAGSRMGKPKSLLTIAGVPILQYLHARLAFQGPTILVTAPGRERPPGSELFSSEVSDPVSDAGPLLGVLTVAGAARTPYLVVTAVDMPFVTSSGLGHLMAALQASDASIAMMSAPEVQPLPMALRVGAALPILTVRWTSKRRALRPLADEPSALVLPAPADLPADFWANLNRPEDLPRY